MSIIYTGQPAPVDGKRHLSGVQAANRAKAMACIESPEATRCKGQVYVGLFFDGTGNNDKWVEDGCTETQRARNKHSNVARLFDAHLSDAKNGFFRYYIPGVGTPFKEIGDTTKWEYGNLGMGLGYKGANRINYAITSLLNCINRYLVGADMFSPSQQEFLVDVASTSALNVMGSGAERWQCFSIAQDLLRSTVKSNQRKLLQINVSIFGFSRGAAEARACAFWLSEICERDGGSMMLAGVPVRIGFMGLFDTVAAVGLGDITPFSSGHMGWADGTQTIHPAVEDCAHFIALHEQRASFPLEAAVGMTNVGYPGVHSDVGGGYFPGEQGRAMAEWGDSPHLSQLPLIDMHFAAIKAGIPMKTIGEIAAEEGLAKSFATDARLIKAYNAWLLNHGIGRGSADEVTQANASQYIRWRASKHLAPSSPVGDLAFVARTNQSDTRTSLKEADEEFGLQLKWLVERRDANATVAGYLRERTRDALRVMTPTGTLWMDPGKSPLSAYEKKFLAIATDYAMPPPSCETLFTDYVHDSRAGFLIAGWREPWLLTGGYLRYRHIFKEAVHAESVVYGWANSGAAALRRASSAVDQFFADLWDWGVSTYSSARRRVEDAVRRKATQAASAIYQAAEQQVLRRYQDLERQLLSELRRRYL